MKSSKDSGANFWIAYADLMAGLLFVFILLIGAIVVKYVLTQSDLKRLKFDLSAQEASLKLSNDELNKREKAILEFIEQLNEAKSQNLALNNLNLVFNSKLNDLNLKLGDVNNSLNIVTIKNKELNATLDERDKKIASLNELLAQKDKEFGALLGDLNQTKNRIKNLTGIRIKVIDDINKKLSGKIKIDKSSGSISLPSSVLFDTNSYAIRDEVKFDLRQALSVYFDILMSDEIRHNIDKIIIEGHTDSTGAYLYNLELSQKRAYEMMKFIYSFYKDERLQNYLLASGRSFNDLIFKDGVEDKEASRRIEIKFSISNKEAIDEIEKFLQGH